MLKSINAESGLCFHKEGIMNFKALYFACLLSISPLMAQLVNQVGNRNTLIMDTQTIKKNELSQLVMRERLNFFRSCAIHSPLPGACIQDTAKGLFYYSSGIDYAPCNGVINNREHIPSENEINNAIEFFHNCKVPFIWWTSEKILEQKGFQLGGSLTGIALDTLEKIPNQELSSQIKIKTVSSKEDLNIFANLVINASGLDPICLKQLQAVSGAAMHYGKQIHFIALIDDNPIGGVTLSTSNSTAGIWNLGTLPEYRKRGVATALVCAALLEAKKLQYNQVIAILMPKGMAWTLFTKLGFKEVCQFPFYVYGAEASKLEK